MKFFSPLPLLRIIGRFIHTNEKLLLALLAVVIVISGSLWYRHYFNISDGGPSAGGTYVDGIVGGSDDLNTVAAKLTKSGLFSFDSEGKLVNHLVESWQVNAEKTIYTFDLVKGVSSEEIVNDLDLNLEAIGPSIVDDKGNGVVVISLADPNPNLPILLTQPIFDYGPYKLSKLSDTTAIFTRNSREHAIKPLINKIVVHAFADKDLLINSLERGKLDGASLSTSDEIEGYRQVEFESPSYYSVIININKSPFRDANYRKNLITGQAVSASSVVLTVSDEPQFIKIAETVKANWGSQGVKVTIEKKTADEISTKTGPSRDFQALLTGISYGPELDPFYLWHSSQIKPPGNNLSGLRSDAIDTLIGQIESELIITERYKKVDLLHQLLVDNGVLHIIKTVSNNYLVSDDVVVKVPYIPFSETDRWQSVQHWYMK